MSYTALVVTLDNNYQNFHAPKRLWDYTRLYPSPPPLQSTGLHFIISGKLSRSLQTKQLDLSTITSLVDAVLHTMDDAITQAAYWVFELLDYEDDLQQATGEIVGTNEDPHITGDSGGTICSPP